MNIYDILINFADHEIRAKKQNENLRKQFIEAYPNEELPESFRETFNICESLKTICQEIIDIKEKLDMK